MVEVKNDDVADFGELASDVITNMPRVENYVDNPGEVVQDEVQEVVQDEVKNESEGSELLDDEGTPWDEEKHKSPPKKKKDGTWVKRMGAQAHKRNNTGSDGGDHIPEINEVDPEEEARVHQEEEAQRKLASDKSCFISAQVSVMMLVQAGKIIGGDEWEPRKVERPIGNGEVMVIDEREQLTTAFYEYYKLTEMEEIPPGYMLTFSLMMYAAPRFTMPKTKSFTSKWGTKIKLWFQEKILRRRRKALDEDIDNGEE